MPKLWNETIEAHRDAVRTATLDATAALVAEHGLTAVTMSQIAKQAGIGRATLYKYFPDVESILVAWHERQVADHLAQLVAIRDQTTGAREQLHAVVEAYALISYQRGKHHGTDVSALLHRGEPMAQSHRQLTGLVRDLLAEGAKTGEVRDDVAPEELAHYCLFALSAAAGLPSQAAVGRLVAVTLAGMHPSTAAVGPSTGDAEAAAPHHRGHTHHRR